MRHVVFAAIVLAGIPAEGHAQSRDSLVRDFMLCVRRNAEVLEPSEDPPQDVARAAIFLCGREEAAAINANVDQANRLREAAILYGGAQATIARLCRRTRRCGLAPVGG